MANNNQVILKGNLGQDPDVYQDKNGNSYVVLSLCTQDSYQEEQSKQWVRLPEVWHTVFVFGKTAEIANSFRKGERIEVLGKLSYRTTEVMIEGKKQRFTEATITARLIKDARLRKKLEQRSSAEIQGAA